MQKRARPRPWILWRRCLGVVFPVARYADEGKARERARHSRLFVAHKDALSADMRSALGVRS